jgi:predicted nucleic acid-binding protein
MSRIFWDTNLFVYLFSQHAEFSTPTANLWRRIHDRGDQLVTSWLTVSEVQVKPRTLGDHAACSQFKQAILQVAEVAPFAEAASNSYVHIRSTTSIKGPDAMQLACAAAAGVELFVTNDQRLTKVTVPGIHFITSLDRVPF